MADPASVSAGGMILFSLAAIGANVLFQAGVNLLRGDKRVRLPAAAGALVQADASVAAGMEEQAAAAACDDDDDPPSAKRSRMAEPDDSSAPAPAPAAAVVSSNVAPVAVVAAPVPVAPAPAAVPVAIPAASSVAAPAAASASAAPIAASSPASAAAIAAPVVPAASDDVRALVSLMRDEGKAMALRVCRVAEMLQASPNLPLSARVEEDGSTLLMALLDFLERAGQDLRCAEFNKFVRDAAYKVQHKLTAWNAAPYVPSDVKRPDLQTELHRVFRTNVCNSYLSEWVHALVTSGVDVNARDADGWTALLIHSSGNTNAKAGQTDNLYVERADWLVTSRADELRMLMKLGADPNATNSFGENLLHVLVRHQRIVTLRELTVLERIPTADPYARNKDGLTPLQLAQKLKGAHEAELCSLLRTLETAWQRDVRPKVQVALEEKYLHRDTASIVLGYLDGSGPAFSSGSTKSKGKRGRKRNQQSSSGASAAAAAGAAEPAQ